MRIILFIISVFFIASCSNQVESTNTPDQKVVSNPETLSSRILFVWKNSWNWAYYNIIISCTDDWIQWINEIPETEIVEIILMENCKKQKISKNILDVLTSKKFYYVYWDFYFQWDQLDHSIYRLDDEEAKKIGNAQWKIQALEGVSLKQAKIIRNTKNTIREAFEPTWNRNFYTEEEAKKCDTYWKWSEFIQDEKIWRRYADKVLKCYRELPPLL